jgi:hypothetical protein
MYIAYHFFERAKNSKYHHYYIEGEYVSEYIHINKNEIFIKFLNESVFPLLRMRLRELIENAKDILEHLQQMLSVIMAKLPCSFAVSSAKGYHLFARSYGGIASEVATLFTLIVSLTRSEAFSISVDAQRVYALREEIGYGV